jgi:hypothetical protein
MPLASPPSGGMGEAHPRLGGQARLGLETLSLGRRIGTAILAHGARSGSPMEEP